MAQQLVELRDIWGFKLIRFHAVLNEKIVRTLQLQPASHLCVKKNLNYKSIEMNTRSKSDYANNGEVYYNTVRWILLN